MESILEKNQARKDYSQSDRGTKGPSIHIPKHSHKIYGALVTKRKMGNQERMEKKQICDS